MGAWALRIMAAVGILTTMIILLELAAFTLEEKWSSRKQRKLDAKHSYMIIQGGKHYIADAPDLEKAMEIIKLDEYGMWKTERGLKGPWKLMEERHD